LDTHAFYWWSTTNPALSPRAKAAISDYRNDVFVSAVTGWEIVAKFRSGKAPEFQSVAGNVAAAIASQGMTELPITVHHAEAAANLPLHHKDPRDCFIIAQAVLEDMTIVTAGAIFASYEAKLLW
jgi:PIN domain nuclease of toxin-antitoxin system